MAYNVGSKGEVDPEAGKNWKVSANHMLHSWAASQSFLEEGSEHLKDAISATLSTNTRNN